MPTNGDFSLYFHIPFCTKKCGYCHFYVLPDKADLKESFLKGVLKEIRLQAPLLPKEGLVSLYFGGGTPSLMEPSGFDRILNALASYTNIAPHAEITLEANPDSLTHEKIKGYRSLGINRVSLGVQSLDDSLLSTLTRKHSAKKAKDALFALEECGIRNVSLDLMYDVPGQTLSSFENTLKALADLPFTHLSLYNLTFEEGTLFHKKKKALSPLVPDGENSKNMYVCACDALERLGKPRYEISAFSAPGKRSRHNVGYWQGRPFLGFGPSAFSYWGGTRFRNAANLKKYLSDLESGALPVDFSEHLPNEQKRKELLAIGIRIKEGVDKKTFQDTYGPFSEETLKSLDLLQKKGWIEKDSPCISLTDEGLLFYDSVAEELI